MSEELTIKPLSEMPKVKTKVKKKGDLRKLLEKFDEDNMKIAEIPVPKGAKPLGLRIGLGRILKTDKRKDIIVYERADGRAVILKRT